MHRPGLVDPGVAALLESHHGWILQTSFYFTDGLREGLGENNDFDIFLGGERGGLNLK